MRSYTVGGLWFKRIPGVALQLYPKHPCTAYLAMTGGAWRGLRVWRFSSLHQSAIKLR